jgi:hypothetical protein
VALAALWPWVQVKAANYLRDRDEASLIAAATATLRDIIDKPDTSEPHRARLRAKLEEVQILQVDRKLERLKALKVLTVADMRQEKHRRQKPGRTLADATSPQVDESVSD